MGIIYQRTTVWLLLHSVPVSLSFVAVPLLLRAMGQDPRLCNVVAHYVVRLLPILFLNSLIRCLRVQACMVINFMSVISVGKLTAHEVPACSRLSKYCLLSGLITNN